MPKHDSTVALPFGIFSDADLAWIQTTAESDLGLALELHTTGDDRGHMLYADPLDDRHSLFPWCVVAVAGTASVTVEKSYEAPPYMDRIQTQLGPVVPYASLRAALFAISAEHGDAMAA
jgi:hypothetical protein